MMQTPFYSQQQQQIFAASFGETNFPQGREDRAWLFALLLAYWRYYCGALALADDDIVGDDWNSRYYRFAEMHFGDGIGSLSDGGGG